MKDFLKFTSKRTFYTYMEQKLPFLLLFMCLIFSTTSDALAQKEGYEIKVSLDNYESDTLLFGYHFGNKQYIKDTVIIDPGQTEYIFKGDETLDCGIYLAIMRPKNNYFQILVEEDNQHFSLVTDAKEPIKKMKVKGSDENALFYKYMNFLSLQGPKAKGINEKIKAAKEKKEDTSSLEKSLKDINTEVVTYQKEIINKSNALTARIIKASMDIDLPEFGKDDESQKARFYYIKDHWFDNIDLADPCLLRSTVLKKKVDTYLKNFTPS